MIFLFFDQCFLLSQGNFVLFAIFRFSSTKTYKYAGIKFRVLYKEKIDVIFALFTNGFVRQSSVQRDYRRLLHGHVELSINRALSAIYAAEYLNALPDDKL